jgi:hypothetical protein
MELNLKRDFQFAGKEYGPRRQDAKTAATRIIRAPDRTAEEMMGAWNQYLDNLYREQVKLYGDIQAARTLGLSDKEIRRQLIKEAKLGADEVNMIMRGQFYPGSASEELLKDIRMQERFEKINRVTPSAELPVREFNRATRARMRQELIPEAPVAEAAPTEDLNSLFDVPADDLNSLFDLPAGGGGGGSSSQGAAPPPPAFDSVPAPSAPQLPTAPANRASLSPSLLGGDLASQMANMEIARRISGQ